MHMTVVQEYFNNEQLLVGCKKSEDFIIMLVYCECNITQSHNQAISARSTDIVLILYVMGD